MIDINARLRQAAGVTLGSKAIEEELKTEETQGSTGYVPIEAGSRVDLSDPPPPHLAPRNVNDALRELAFEKLA